MLAFSDLQTSNNPGLEWVQSTSPYSKIIFHNVLTGCKELIVVWSCSDFVDGDYNEAGEPHTDPLCGNTLIH